MRDKLPPSLCAQPAEAANSLVCAVRNHKVTMKALKELQVAAQQTPLVLVKTCNTRKWSADYLVAQRLLKLKSFVQAMYANPQLATHLPPEIDWARLQNFVSLCFPFYFAEQVLQRDASNAIHYAHFWAYTRDRALAICSNLLHQQELSPNERLGVEACRNKIEKRDRKVKECGVFRLCEMLWPDPKPVSTAVWNDVLVQLRWLVDKQWEKWMELKDVVQFPCDDDDEQQHKEDFIRLCVLQLSQHRSAELELVESSRAAFARQIQAAVSEYELSGCYAKPKTAKSPIWSCYVHAYWSTLRFSCPEIYFIYQILSHCCATEAGTERMFSSEKMIHSMIRNRLDPQLVAAIMTIRWNYEALQQFEGKTVQTDKCDDDIEFVEYDE
jgi:hypothetical protein